MTAIAARGIKVSSRDDTGELQSVGEEGASPTPRPSGLGITDELGGAWGALAPALRAYLLSLGVPPHQVDDFTQDVVVKVMEKRPSYVTAADLRPWCFTVARNLWFSACRRPQLVSLETLGDQGSAAAQDDLKRVEDRLLLACLTAHIAELSVTESAALLDALRGKPLDPSKRNSQNVARHRARQKLKWAVGPLAALLGIGHGRRWRAGWKPGAVAAPSMVVSAALFVMPFFPFDSHDGDFGATHPTYETFASLRQTTVARPSTGPAIRAVRESGEGRLRAGQAATTRPVVEVRAPFQTHARVAVDQEQGEEPLVCVDPGLDDREICIDHPLDRPGGVIGLPGVSGRR